MAEFPNVSILNPRNVLLLKNDIATFDDYVELFNRKISTNTLLYLADRKKIVPGA